VCGCAGVPDPDVTAECYVCSGLHLHVLVCNSHLLCSPVVIYELQHVYVLYGIFIINIDLLCKQNSQLFDARLLYSFTVVTAFID